MIDLGTLGGPNSESFANLNDAIQVAGTAETSVTDPNNENFCSFGTSLICLGFVWQNGIMTPLSNLGGNNGQAAAINNRGQVAGYAETPTPDPNCPLPQVLQYRPTLWTAGHPKALPLYPGDTEGAAFWMNNSGIVVGATGVCAPYDPRYALPLQPRHAVSGATVSRLTSAISAGNSKTLPLPSTTTARSSAHPTLQATPTSTHSCGRTAV